jgi:hypothetical protein
MSKNCLSDSDRLAVYADVEESVIAIIGYDSGQFFWRSIAITLIIGNLAVIGFLLGAEAQGLPFSTILASIWTCVIFLSFNFCIIWTDLFKEEKLLLSCLFNVLNKEKENKWLFPIFKNSKDEEGRRHGALEKKIQ